MKEVFTHMLIPQKSARFLPRFSGMCLFLMTSFLMHAQERSASGTVEDDGDQHLAMAGFLVKSTFNGVTAHADERHCECLIVKNELNQI